MDHNDKGNHNMGTARNNDDGVHNNHVRKDDSVHDDSNHDKGMELESFFHLLIFSHFTLCN